MWKYVEELEVLDGVSEEGKYSEVGRRWRGPPSRERETWILVSLVFLLMKAVRGGRGSAIVRG